MQHILIEKFTFIQPLIKFSLCYKTRRFTTLLTKRHHWTRYITKCIKPTQRQPASSRCVPKIIYPCGLPANIFYANSSPRQFRWPRALRRGSAAALLLRERIRIAPRARMLVSYTYCVLPVEISYTYCVLPVEISYTYCVLPVEIS